MKIYNKMENSKRGLFRKEKSIEEITAEIEIPEEVLKELAIIAQIIGGDYGMIIRIGKPGEGSFFDPENNSITLDPLHIIEDPILAKFVAGHEGSHRAITRGPKEIGVPREEIIELLSQLAFRFLWNAIEDPAVNRWMMMTYPGMRRYVTKVYDEQLEKLEKENAVFGSPEIRRLIAKLGYVPRFVVYGSQIIRDWHQGRFSEKLDPAVEEALRKTIGFVRQSISTIPPAGERNERKIIEYAQERFRIIVTYIWPEVRKLAEMDLDTEVQRQMMKEFRQKQKKLEQKRREMERAKAEGNIQKQEELQKEIDELEKELTPFDRLPEDIKKELQEQIDKAIQEAIEKLNKEIEEKQKQIEEAKQRQEQLEKEIRDLEEKAKQATGKEKEELEKQIKEKKTEKLVQERKQKEAEKDLKDIQDTLDDLQSGEGMPYPEDKLSERTKEELKKLFQKLPYKKQEDLRKKAKEQLEDLEDALNSELEGKLNKDKPETHRERREREEKERRIEEEKKRIEKEEKKLAKKLEEMRREKMTEYEKAYEEVADIINALYNRLKNLFLPQRHPRWQKGFPTGSRVDLSKAMQAEADPRYLGEIWERKTIPRKFDYRFYILVDLSGSMRDEKINETFKGLVVLVEVLERLGIQYMIRGFSDNSQVFKNWREKLTPELRNRLAEMKRWGGGGTETTEATREAVKDLMENLGKDNFLITLTDGQPNDPDSLKKELTEIIKERKIKLVGIGLGPDTEFVKDYYPASLSLPHIRPTEEQRRQGQKDFAEAFADLLEDMIRHPEKY